MGEQDIWFWQRIISPHMAWLAAVVTEKGFEIVYVAEHTMSNDRSAQGWAPPSLGKARLEMAPTAAGVRLLVKAAPPNSIHICQGIRANGLVGKAQRALYRRRLRQWVVMETVDDSGWWGFLKRLEYRRLFLKWRGRIEGVLATGHRTASWVAARGMPAERVFPFAYFLPAPGKTDDFTEERTGPFRFVFVGQFIPRKRLDILISSLGGLNRKDFELVVVGSGPMESHLRTAAESALANRVRWIGRLPITEVHKVMAQADCLVLPSRHDGWGAVVSEALMVGTPVICSDACGSAGVVRASGVGGVFQAEKPEDLSALLIRTLESGRLGPEARVNLAAWAKCLGADSGADYLMAVLDCVAGFRERPQLPWEIM